MIDWLIDCLIDILIDLFIDLLIDRAVCYSVHVHVQLNTAFTGTTEELNWGLLRNNSILVVRAGLELMTYGKTVWIMIPDSQRARNPPTLKAGFTRVVNPKEWNRNKNHNLTQSTDIPWGHSQILYPLWSELSHTGWHFQHFY